MINNEEYMRELMDSIRLNKNGMRMMTSNHQFARTMMLDSTLQHAMIDEMMEMNEYSPGVDDQQDRHDASTSLK